ncbi:FkbM family methyltransferase [Bradyrhizobium diazoefficiens]|uniref:FkbM family methyltransferase n=1 Tax=Bradyrhizobium diazoefficiens TaxID=1355477 RepID=UPI00190AE649|nr:FkbM family methyltransferase [Bradyrhizobium diazoefficiens]MBK3665340.1 FkbM family methyltransferase [Bradyrhizobium diazoefficiens]
MQRVISSLSYRAKWAQLGVIYGRSFRLEHIKLGGKRLSLDFPNTERPRQEHEFSKILIDDCYRLKEVRHAQTILDIGSNIGLFAIAARRRFPRATIHCYEPNPAVIPYLQSHCTQTRCQLFPAAVGLSEGRVSLRADDEGTLFSTTVPNPSGGIPQVSFASAIEKLGTVDLLKLDCEGAEWEIFDDVTTWKSVHRLAMEYHLWAREGATVATLREILSAIGFQQIDIRDEGFQWGLAFASR